MRRTNNRRYKLLLHAAGIGLVLAAMLASDLLQQPVWEADGLGRPLPHSTHGISVALPRWQDVIGYEEKKSEVVEKMSSGYPRFVVHPLVSKLAKELGGGENALPFPSRRAAESAAEFVKRTSAFSARVLTKNGISVASTDVEGMPALRAFWQHTGLIVSSRQAEAALAGRQPNGNVHNVRTTLRRQIADWYDCAEDDVFLAPTGMASVYAALRAVRARRPIQRTIQLGFPYVDTLKLQEKFGAGATLLPNLETIEAELRSLLNEEALAGCFCEIPGNPLLGSVDLRAIGPLLRKHGVPLIADDVVATPLNVDLSPYADLIATSLTKFVVGTCDAMGGALICNRASPYYAELKGAIRSQHEELLWGEDAVVLAEQAESFPERMQRHNENGLWIAEQLRAHPATERVWYPKWESAEAYEAVRRVGGGWGALLSFLPKDGKNRSPMIYDRLPLCKGPSLGAVFTLACPFTLLAHYTELDWAESCGVSRYLIRLSVGLEEPEELWERISRALD